ncbi:hypothetical protein F5148DRAFT_1214795 [Russula earlei]|uniref:Uncharacterized protein n=1 Tax=Russula earlei TaxID=71964 RepID=A0ACC0U457_9AGAM|nr:hypothetical protein F5148DRAFT_1214795 [Russula earlei]
MPTSPPLSPPPSSLTESRHDHPLVAAAETPEQAQRGSLSASAIPGGLQQSVTIGSSLDAPDRRSMAENTISNDNTSPPPARAANNRPHTGSARRHVRPALPDPAVAAPNVSRAAVQPSPSGGNAQEERLSAGGRILFFFGYGRNNRARKELVSVISSVAMDVSQIVVIIAFLTISSHRRSPLIPSENEWDACGKPLGTWDALWVVRLSLDIWLCVWRWSRERTKRLQDESNGHHAQNDAEVQPRHRPNTAPPGGRTHSLSAQRSANAAAEGQSQAAPVTYPRIYARLSLMGSTFTLVWFVLVQILMYGSTNTCRRTSPHLWWLTFGVLSVMYIMILEVVVVAILVFVVGPILFLFWSILLLCLGRHPSQNPHQFTPDIGQVPRAVVDKLPLVLYIPPPPDQPPKPVTLPSDLHSYPPKSPTSRRRLRFLPLPSRRRPGSTGDAVKDGAGKEKRDPNRPLTWEDNWEKGDYPFVQLDSHRASCAICLLDFQEPKRVEDDGTQGLQEAATPKTDGETEVAGGGQEVAGNVAEEAGIPAARTGDLALRLQDAGQGAQPLRLLKCGHVFHKTCVDPWLLDVSGRCPVCQRPVREQADADAMDTEQDARPARRRWFRRSRRRGPA